MRASTLPLATLTLLRWPAPAPRWPAPAATAGLDAEADLVGPGIYGGRVERSPDGSVVIGKQYEEHNALPGPVYAGGGYTEMSRAIHSGPEAVAAVLQCDPAAANEVMTGGARPLHMCGMSRRGELSAAVLVAAGAEVDVADTWGYTPLMRMASNNLGIGARSLLQAGADRLRPSGLEGVGQSARDLALRLRSFDVIREMQRWELEQGLPLPEGEPQLYAPDAPDAAPPARTAAPRMQLSSGLTFDDGEQRLVSVQKPLGLLLEEVDGPRRGVVVATVSAEGSAAGAGVLAGDVLLAVNNQAVSAASLEQVMGLIQAAPRVVNLRFARTKR